MEKYINPFTDWAFKRIFGQEANKDLLINFLNELLNDKKQHIVDLQYLDKEQLGETQSERNVIYDIFCVTDQGKHFIVEMQNNSQSHFIDRSLYYASRSIVSQALRDKRDSRWNYQLKPVYTVCFMNFALPLGPDIPKRFRTDIIMTTAQDGKVVKDTLRFIYLMLPLFPIKKEADCKSNFERWIYILTNMETMEQMPYTSLNETFQKLEKIMQRLSLKQDENEYYERSLKNYRDYYNQLKYAQETSHEEGYEEGFEKGEMIGLEKGEMIGLEKGEMIGEKKGQIKTARNLKQMGLSIDLIMNATSLTAEEIAQL